MRFAVGLPVFRLTGGGQCWAVGFLVRDGWEELFPRCVPCCQVSGGLALQHCLQPWCFCTAAGSGGACWDLAAPFH